MPAKEIKELRQQGKLDEAYTMAKTELDADSENIWCKRNMSWVLYSQLDSKAEDISDFIAKLDELKEIELPSSEDLFWGNVAIPIAKASRAINKYKPIDLHKLHNLWDAIKTLPIDKNVKWYNILYSAFHKGMKESNRYIEFADWWDFKNFKPEDFQKEKLPDGREVMALAEQAYIAYAKHLLPKKNMFGDEIFDREKLETFLPYLSEIVDNYPDFVYPAYFKAKLLLALNTKENILDDLLPFAKKKRNDFWVWEVLAEAVSDEPEKVFACYCKALSCKSPQEMLVNLRHKMANLLKADNHFNEAKTEIDLVVAVKTEKGNAIPNSILSLQNSEWYKTAVATKSNVSFYKSYLPLAEAILFRNDPEELVIVDALNLDKNILNFIASEKKYGFFKYNDSLKLKVGDVLKVRFEGNDKDGFFKTYTANRVIDLNFRSSFVKKVLGIVRVNEKGFAFVDDVYVHASQVSKLKLVDGSKFDGEAIKSYNKPKKEWGWKLI